MSKQCVSDLTINSDDIQCENEEQLCEDCENTFINSSAKKRITSFSEQQRHLSCHSSSSTNNQQLDERLSSDNQKNDSNPCVQNLDYDISIAQTITADEYEESLSRLTDNKFLSLRQLELINATDEQLLERVVNIYGIVDSVINVNDLHKRLLIVDPTIADKMAIILNNINTNIATKNIIRLTNVSIVTSSDGKVFAVNERRNFAQFHAFTYDYECDNDFNYQLVFGKNNVNLESDKSVSKLLEEWFAQRFLTNNGLHKLLMPSIKETYVDFACLVIATQLMKQTIQLTVYDGNQPNLLIENQFRNDYSVDGATNSYYRFNNEEVYQNKLNHKHFGFVNVWRNKSNQHNDHYHIAEGTTLMNGDDLLILFNVELNKGEQNDSVRLHLRSGRHHGKGIRKVNRLSILGRKLIAKIRGYCVKPVSENVNPIEEINMTTLSNFSLDETIIASTCVRQTSDVTISETTATNSKTFNKLLKLGSRQLQALFDQQIREKDYPLIYRNSYNYSLNLIEDVLNKSRQLSKFPNTFETNIIPQLTEINELNSTESNINDLYLIRAKVIDLFPKSVFPSDKFVFLKCNSCDFVETFKNQSNLVNASIGLRLIQCPQCSDGTTLTYFYAIIFVIQDINSTAKVCLTKQNAVNVFGIEANKVLKDADSALLIDNILFEIVKMSNRDNGIDWIIKKNRNSKYMIHEVITLAPLATFSNN